MIDEEVEQKSRWMFCVCE